MSSSYTPSPTPPPTSTTTTTNPPTHAGPLLPLIVAQYELKGHPTRTEHWNLVLLRPPTPSTPSPNHTFEVRGNIDSFTYVPEANTGPLKRIYAYRGGCHIGYIPESYIPDLTERLREVTIVKHDTNWDSQKWVLEAIKLLKSDPNINGLVFKSMIEGGVLREELAKDMARWDEAEDTVDERLLSAWNANGVLSPSSSSSASDQ